MRNLYKKMDPSNSAYCQCCDLRDCRLHGYCSSISKYYPFIRWFEPQDRQANQANAFRAKKVICVEKINVCALHDFLLAC